MATARLITYEEASPEVRQVFDDIRTAMRRLALHGRVLAEPSGAASFAATLRPEKLPPFRKAVAIISGGNVEPALLAQVVQA